MSQLRPLTLADVIGAINSNANAALNPTSAGPSILDILVVSDETISGEDAAPTITVGIGDLWDTADWNLCSWG